jgi:hypothetical protein
MNSGSRTVSRLAAAQQRARAFDYRPGLPCAAKAGCQHGEAKNRGPLERLPTALPSRPGLGLGRTKGDSGNPTKACKTVERPGPKDMND